MTSNMRLVELMTAHPSVSLIVIGDDFRTSCAVFRFEKKSQWLEFNVSKFWHRTKYFASITSNRRLVERMIAHTCIPLNVVADD